MGKSEIRDFALRVRKGLMEQVARRAEMLDVTRDGPGASVAAQPVRPTIPEVSISTAAVENQPGFQAAYDALVKAVRERGFDRVVEDAACTWFNRFTCLWYMEVNGYLPEGIPGLSGLERMPHGTGHQRNLIISQCKKLSGMFPYIFEDRMGFEGLLLPDRLLGEDSIVRDMMDSIDREEFLENVQITGWLYQYFISPEKDRVYAALRRNKKTKKDDIAAATQLFTPDWIVKYMVENSLGRLWLEAHPDDDLKSGWRYYLEEAGQSGEVVCRLKEAAAERKGLSPEEIKVLDPAMGSGHILVYAFDVLYSIYLSAGYMEESIPALILENNLYGLDIDDRAAGLAYFALMMKGRSKDSGLFDKKVRPRLYWIRESGDLAIEDVISLVRSDRIGGDEHDCRRDLTLLLETFRDAGELGSVIKLPDMDLVRLRKWWESLGESIGMDIEAFTVHGRIKDLINQALVMQDKYHVVVTNPPYMGIRGMNANLAGYLNTHYKISKHDLFTVFMDLARGMTIPGGFMALINQHSWMFLSSYQRFREEFAQKCCICSMLHLGSGVFWGNVGTIVQSTAFVARNMSLEGYRSVFLNLQGGSSSLLKEQALLGTKAGGGDNVHTLCISDLEDIPGKPIAYWAKESIVRAFARNKKLGELAKPRQGMATSDNNRFVRHWYEVPLQSIGFGCGSADEAKRSGCRWFPYNKGGSYRKWYGNNSLVVNWENGGEQVKELAALLYGSYTRTIKNIQFYFREAITYTFISNRMGVRYSPPGFIFDVAGSSVFAEGERLYTILAFLCSKLTGVFLEILNPTFNIQVGDIKNLPFAEIEDANVRQRIVRLCRENIEISRLEWDWRETSWDFKRHPLIEYRKEAATIEKAYSNWHYLTEKLFNRLKSNEEELNRIFIDLYQLQDALTPGLEDQDITFEKADKAGAVKSFISYAVGCMFGRYTPDSDGILNAGGFFDQSGCMKKVVKLDNIIPVMGEEFFTDNILSRFEVFLESVFMADTLEQNLDYIAAALGKRPYETAREAVGRYFERQFYKDHLNTYNKRPIYWMFSSGREGGFKALVYMHRYSPSILKALQREYLPRVMEVYRRGFVQAEEEVPKGQGTKQAKAAAKRKDVLKRRLEECVIYGRALSRAAHEGITINPDEGVTANYAKFQKIRVQHPEGDGSISVNLLEKWL
ncbi:MAG TPA: BREX-1 system adenine-specific DNA-methyltransferase PglX [Clostridia bacterium]|nr:BREX-1 system adenine-specific DNA-methyltransferase PglX [Clostridia bacterium]